MKLYSENVSLSCCEGVK